MKKVKTIIVIIPMMIVTLISTTSISNAEPFGTWEYIDSVWEDGGWTVTERCEPYGNECNNGDISTFRIEPE